MRRAMPGSIGRLPSDAAADASCSRADRAAGRRQGAYRSDRRRAPGIGKSRLMRGGAPLRRGPGIAHAGQANCSTKRWNVDSVSGDGSGTRGLERAGRGGGNITRCRRPSSLHCAPRYANDSRIYRSCRRIFPRHARLACRARSAAARSLASRRVAPSDRGRSEWAAARALRCALSPSRRRQAGAGDLRLSRRGAGQQRAASRDWWLRSRLRARGARAPHFPSRDCVQEDAKALVTASATPRFDAPGLAEPIYRETEGDAFFLTSILQSLSDGEIQLRDSRAGRPAAAS